MLTFDGSLVFSSVRPENLRQNLKLKADKEKLWSTLLVKTEAATLRLTNLTTMLEGVGFEAAPFKMANFLVTNFNDPPLIVEVNGSLEVDLEALTALSADQVVDLWLAQEFSLAKK